MRNGQPQRSDVRLFMQFLAFGGCESSRPLVEAAAGAGVTGVLYEDVNDPRGIALLTLSEDPGFSLDRVRPTTVEWLDVARRYVTYANQAGLYDDVKTYLEKGQE